MYVICQLFISIIISGDRYAPEPRTRSTFSDNWKMSSSKYTDEDEDTSSKPYHDESPETELVLY